MYRKNVLRKGIIISLVAGVLYLPMMQIVKTFSDTFSRQIGSQTELEEVIANELPHYRNRKDTHLIPVYDHPRLKDVAGISWRINENTFVIGATHQRAVRHELEHIFDGHLDRGNLPERKGIDKLIGYCLYWAYYEPKATVSELGIRL